MDIVTYALSKKLVNGIQSGLASATVDNDNCSITFNWTNGTSSTMTFPKPADGVSITNAYIDDTNHLMMELSSGATIDAGVITGGNGGSYDDTAIKADIDSLEGKEIDTLTYTNSELTLTAKDTTTKTVTIKPNLVDLGDVDITSPNGGDVVTYSASTGKFTTGQVLSTDQYVKMTASDTNASYLADLIDDDTIKNNGSKLEVEKIKGQNITVDELNTLVGMNTNVKDSLNALASGGMVFKDVVPTYADLPNSAVNGFVYIVNADETDNGNRNAYIYSDDHAGFVLVGTSGLDVRNFTTNPIDLTSEVINILPKDKMETTDLIDKTKDVINTLSYPIPDEDLQKIPNLEVLKQINTEVINALNGKMNNTDIVDNLTDNSTDKPLSANQGNVLDTKIGHKIDNDKIVTTLDSTVTDEQIPSAKVTHNELSKKVNKTDIKTTLDETSTNEDVYGGKAIYDTIKKNCVGKETVLYEGNISATGTYTLNDDVNNYDFIIINHAYNTNAKQSVILTKNEIKICIDQSHGFGCIHGNGSVSCNISGYFNGDKVIISNQNTEIITSIIGYKLGQITVQNTITNPSPEQSYSTEETLTGGTWIDGKPIYRKVFSISPIDLPEKTWTSTNITIDNIDKLISAKCTLYPYFSTFKYSGTLSAYAPFGSALGDEIIVEYTKTTDA